MTVIAYTFKRVIAHTPTAVRVLLLADVLVLVSVIKADTAPISSEILR